MGVFFHVHEDEGRYFEALREDFDAGTSVAAADPELFFVGDGVPWDADAGAEELVAVGDCGFLPVDLVGVFVEGVVAHHLEECEVPSAFADFVEVVESDARLGDD